MMIEGRINNQAGGRYRLLIIHQSAEMYGSDRSLLDALAGLDKGLFECLVCLPETGPLVGAIRSLGVEVHVIELVKISRGLFTPFGMLGLPNKLYQAQSQINRVVAGRAIHAVYTNTVAVMAGAIWAKRNRLPHIWHIREIIERPRWVAWAIRQMVVRTSNRILCNSEQTQRWVNAVSAAAAERSQVIWNGVDVQDGLEEHATHSPVSSERPTLLLIGRINAWKGQDLLLEALAELRRSGRLIFRTVIMGSAPPGQAHFEEQLRQQVEVLGLGHDVELWPFSEDASKAYRQADAVVVPSRLPEPFGRVAIEAMAFGLPVVAAAHGGLTEIVVDGETGVLVPPNRSYELAHALNRVMSDEGLRLRLGGAGKRRQLQHFSLQAYRAAVSAALLKEVR